VTPVFATADRGVINGLARLGGIDPRRLGKFRNVAEFVRYSRGSDTFEVVINQFKLIVKPIQPIREDIKCRSCDFV
jgi:hypothetical protein